MWDRCVFVAMSLAIISSNAFAQECLLPFSGWCERHHSRSERGASAPSNQRLYASVYGAILGEPFPVPAVRLADLDPAYLRNAVPYPSNEPPGTIIIDPQRRYLFLSQFTTTVGCLQRYSVSDTSTISRALLGFKRFSSAARGRQQLTVSRTKNHNLGTKWRALIEIHDVLIEHPNAAG